MDTIIFLGGFSMKKTLKLLTLTVLIAAFLVSITVIPSNNLSDKITVKTSAIGTQVASYDFTNNTGNKMSFVNSGNQGDEAYSEQANIGGVNCRKIPAGKFLYVNVDASAVSVNDRNVLIDVTYYDGDSNTIWFNYNGTSGDYAGADFSKSGGGGWTTSTIVLTDAQFNNKMRDGTEIRMGHNGSDNYIRSITVSLGTLNPDNEPIPANPTNGSVDNNFKNKSFAGYQVWHRAGNNPGDWVHWSYGKLPAPGLQVNVNVCSYPDTSEYPDDYLYPTNLGNLGDGRPAKLYGANDARVINKQFDWLQTAGLDGVAIQRFVGGIGKSLTKSDTDYHVTIKNNCERTGRLFYICYDLNGAGDDILDRFKMDWVYQIEQNLALTSSPNYARVNGKPVVEIWGIGYNFGIDQNKMQQIINFFHSRGCYLIGGTPRGWRNDAVYNQSFFYNLDCISPWTVGVYSDRNGANGYYNNEMKADYTACQNNNTDYLPVCFAGSGIWVNGSNQLSEVDREGGKLLWTQIRNAKALGCNAVYFAMLDEFEENTNLINSARDYFDIPTSEYFETLAKNGIWTSSDYYLRLAATASKLLRGQIANTEDIPIAYSEGPLYFRNSFESRTSTFRREGTATATLKLDPCFYNAGQVRNENMGSGNASIIKFSDENLAVKTGDYAVKVTGNAGGTSNHKYLYRTNETKIKVNNGMKLSFDRYATNDNGKYVSVDLIFSDGTIMSDILTNNKATGNGNTNTWQNVEYTIGSGSTVGKTITGIGVAYESTRDGAFTAYIDNVKIEDGEAAPAGGPVDLHVTASQPSISTLNNGDSTKFYCTLRNTSGNDTQGNIKVDFYVDNRFVETINYNEVIPAGSMKIISTANNRTVFFGSHTIKVVVNSDNAIEDTDRTNDALKSRFIVSDN
jgi:hypothetical protein